MTADGIPAADDPAAFPRWAHRLTADLLRPDPRVYWADLLATALVTYTSLAVALHSTGALGVAAGMVCVLALYRAISFIHELTHLRRGDAPGFKAAWNLLIGAPFLTPSFLYEGVHNLHHARSRYGTTEDPEYLPLTRSSVAVMAGFVAVSLLAPVALTIRFAVLAPLSFAHPAARRFVVARVSALSINPGFVRRDVQKARRAAWLAQEIACWLWSWTLLALVFAGALPIRVVMTIALVMAAAALLNQLRTAGAHYWESDGSPMSFIDQFRDTVNVPPPGPLAMLWAPLGLRYHALHHLLPGLPYHNLAAAHRRLAEGLPVGSPYRQVEQSGLFAALSRLSRRIRAA